MTKEELLSQIHTLIANSGFTVEEIQEILYRIKEGEESYDLV